MKETLEKVYSAIPKIACKGLCHECCGPILMSKEEWRRIVQRVGHEPKIRDDGICPMLDPITKTCTVYDIRPAICRLWGCTADMKCQFGCQPERELTREESFSLIDRCNQAGGSRRGRDMKGTIPT